MGYFSPFRRIFIQRLLRHVAPEMAIAFTEDFPCQTSRVSYDGGEFFAALNSTSDAAGKIVIRVNQMPDGVVEMLDDSGNWVQCDDLKITKLNTNDALLTWERPLEPLSGLMFRIH